MCIAICKYVTTCELAYICIHMFLYYVMYIFRAEMCNQLPISQHKISIYMYMQLNYVEMELEIQLGL